MTRIFWREVVRLGLVGVVVGSAIACWKDRAIAQITPDNSLGGDNSVVNDTGNGIDSITGGATRNTNLFHSFEQFSVQNGRIASFENAPNIQNIITRVTGNSISDIDGAIAARGTANLFLLNPNGIVFGQNARLDIGGSFIATTARSINFTDGTQFSATPGTGAPLLTVSVPIGLQFGTNPGSIINRASGAGLQLGAGRTIGLFGGNISLNGGRLTAKGGRIELGAVAAPGVIGISPDNSGFRFSFPTDLTLGDISLTNLAGMDTRAGGGGSIAINTNNLSLTEGSEIITGIFRNQGSVGAVAGDIDINAQGAVTIDGVGQFPEGIFSSGIFNNVEQGSTGRGGNINLKVNSLSLTNSGVISASTLGTGDAGNVNITARDGISLDQSTIFSQVDRFGIGNGGNITINARSLSLNNGAQITTSSFGQGNSGSVTIDARDRIAVDSGSVDFPGGIRSTMEATSTGNNGGNVNVIAGSLSLTNGAVISASTFSSGNAGNVTIDARDAISIDGIGRSGFATGVFSTSQQSTGNSGNINVTTGSLFLTNGGGISTSTFSPGNAGNITIDARDTISIDGFAANGLNSGVFNLLGSLPEFQGDRLGGDIRINARSLSLTNGGQLNTDTFGRGNAGSVNIRATDAVTITGSGSGVRSNVLPTALGNGGDINIQTGSLFLSDKAQLLSSTIGQGNAGNIQINATDSVVISSGSVIGAASFSRGNAGSVTIVAGDRVSVEGTDADGSPSQIVSALAQLDRSLLAQLPASVQLPPGLFELIPQPQGERKGGNIRITARSLSLADGAQLNASTLFTQEEAGNIDVEVRSLDLDRGIIGAISTSGNGGNIRLRASKSLRLRNNSQISTTAGASQQPGNGGNITINSPLILANSNGNSDITANAFSGSGGRVDITADSIFGLIPRSRQELQTLLGTDDPIQLDPSRLPSNDITAISQTNPSLSGTVTFNAADIDPSRDIVELPTGLFDASTLVAAGCPSGAENRFAITGRGGLPPAPGDKLSTEAILTDWAISPKTSNRATVEPTIPTATTTTANPPVETITEASSWQFDRDGNTILTAAPQASDRRYDAPAISCHGS